MTVKKKIKADKMVFLLLATKIEARNRHSFYIKGSQIAAIPAHFN